jgi:Family of unknown function (DUF5681)
MMRATRRAIERSTIWKKQWRNEMQDDPSRPGYEVGYRRPPRHTQFKKGQSGNPKGRPKGSKNFDSMVAHELNEQMDIRENGRLKRISKLRLSAKQLANGAAAGQLPYIQFLQPLMEKFRVQEELRQARKEQKGIFQPDWRYWIEVLKILKEIGSFPGLDPKGEWDDAIYERAIAIIEKIDEKKSLEHARAFITRNAPPKRQKISLAEPPDSPMATK